MDILIEQLLFLGADMKLDENGASRTTKKGATLYMVTAFQASSGKTVKLTVEGEPPFMEVATYFKAKARVGAYKDRLWVKALEITPDLDRLPDLSEREGA